MNVFFAIPMWIIALADTASKLDGESQLTLLPKFMPFLAQSDGIHPLKKPSIK